MDKWRGPETIVARAASLLAIAGVPLIVGAYVGEFGLALRERRPAHMLGDQPVAIFPIENERAVEKLRRAGTTAYPFVGPQQFAFRHYLPATAPWPLVPLAGISRVATEMCNEAGWDLVYRSDEHGFNNPAGESYFPRLTAALVGDSFVHGVCVASKQQLSSLIRDSIPGTVNFGVLGAGPLTELGVLREYVAPLRPRIVIWFFYEGNDIEDLERESRSSLARYLDPGFSQHLAMRQPQIDALLSSFADSVLNGRPTEIPAVPNVAMLALPRVRKAIGMVAANLPGETSERDFTTLQAVLVTANTEISGWGGKMLFVYLPDYHRFDRRVLAYAGYVHNNAEIHRRTLAAANRAGLEVIDLAAVFAASRNPRQFWPLPGSHYGPNGYALVAKTLNSVIGNRDRGEH